MMRVIVWFLGCIFIVIGVLVIGLGGICAIEMTHRADFNMQTLLNILGILAIPFLIGVGFIMRGYQALKAGKKAVPVDAENPQTEGDPALPVENTGTPPATKKYLADLLQKTGRVIAMLGGFSLFADLFSSLAGSGPNKWSKIMWEILGLVIGLVMIDVSKRITSNNNDSSL